MKQKIEFIKENDEFKSIIKEIIENEKVQEMHNYRQHYTTSCYEHCYNAAAYCYLICKKLNLDYKSCTRAAMLHDFFLYDWREKTDRHGLHAFTHGKCACKNASEIFDLNDIEKDCITNHMWPVTIKLPKYKETYILTLVDKHCAMQEFFDYYIHALKNKRVFRYAYVFIGLLILKNHK
ncbi:MAG: HD family phosphohydrolase [Clostridia bacterium]|nr:HD family phosphohydrolase [Clostridia bacterium]